MIWNFIALLPATIYFVSWLILSIRAVSASLTLFIIVGSIFLIVSSILSAVILKLRILSEVGDPDLFAVRSIYSAASRINIVSYFILYAVTFSLSFQSYFLCSLFVVVALIMAIPIRLQMSGLSKEYAAQRSRFALGRWKCPKCGVSLVYSRRWRRWRCYRCRKWF